MATNDQARDDLRIDLLVFAGGVAAVAIATFAGWNPRFLTLLVTPPGFVRVAVVAAAVLLAFLLLGRAVDRIQRAAGPRDTVRGVRFVFLAVAALSAAGGWAIGSALPIVIAFVIAGVDVVETTFLLVALGLRR